MKKYEVYQKDKGDETYKIDELYLRDTDVTGVSSKG